MAIGARADISGETVLMLLLWLSIVSATLCKYLTETVAHSTIVDPTAFDTHAVKARVVRAETAVRLLR